MARETKTPPARAARAERVLLTGATGFVGRNLWRALRRAGHRPLGLTRDVASARRRWPRREWAQADVGGVGVMHALEGCTSAYYLVHGMAEGAGDFRRREAEAALSFRDAAERCSLGRIVYLGGVAPRGESSEHLASRVEVGEILRAGRVPTLELRASMIIGAGSLSFRIVRDLAARLPAMVLPRWLRSRTEPVALDDVLVALVRGLRVPPAGGCFDIPGPQILSGKEILEATAGVLGLKRPLSVDVPLLTPWLSSHWVRFVTRADWAVAREIVVGLQEDILARDASYWELIGHTSLLDFAEAARRAVKEEQEDAPGGAWGVQEGLMRAWRARGAAAR